MGISQNRELIISLISDRLEGWTIVALFVTTPINTDSNKVHKIEAFTDQEGCARRAICFLNSLWYQEKTLFLV
jgi:hypothetical protein